MRVEIVPATPAHVAELCADLREREALAFSVLTENAQRELEMEIRRNIVAFAGLVDGRCVALWGAGAATPLDDAARLWLVCSRRSITLPVTFLRHSRKALTDLEGRFRLLYGFVMEDFPASVRWLSWLGFTIDPPRSGVRLFFKEQ